MTQDLETRVRRANLVTQDEQLEQLFGEDLASRLLDHVDHLKEGRMPTRKPFARTTDRETDVAVLPPTQAKIPRRRPVLVAGVLAALLILTVGGILLLRSDEEPEAPVITAPVETETMDLAVAYIEARNAYDTETILDLLSDEVVFSEVLTNDPADIGLILEGDGIGGFQYSPFSCEPFPREGWVSCSYLADSRFQQAVEYPPTEGSFMFAAEDGRLTLVQNFWPYEEFEANAHDPWLAWLRAEDPDVYEQLYDGTVIAATAETLELLAEYLDRYEDSVGG